MRVVQADALTPGEINILTSSSFVLVVYAK